MEKVTAQKIHEAAAAYGVERWNVRPCSLCGVQTGYEFNGLAVTFDASCGCTDYGNLQPRTYDNVADFFNMQTPEIRADLWAKFIAAGTKS